MGGYSLNPEHIERELKKLRKYIVKNRKNLTWREEGELLQQIDTLKRDLQYAKDKNSCPFTDF